MADKPPRSLRTARVVLNFHLHRFHTDLAKLWNRSVERPGRPGDGVSDPTSLRTFGPSYLLAEVLSKYDDGRVSPEKEKETWKRFREAEDLCRDTNERLSVSGFKGPYEGAVELARSICSRILGPFDWDHAAMGMGWGPGACTRLPRRKSDAAYKYSGFPETTSGNSALAVAAIRSDEAWERAIQLSGANTYDQYIKVVDGNRVVTVPKNYKTDRTIAIEPCMNIYVQKGIGALIRRRLLTAGCNLDDQTRNQRLARVGSISGRLATIDLSMASDTVARQLVTRFIRADWADALEQCRSPYGVLPSGEKIFYQKFSSMGNGFTFELESLIFYSLALAWCHIHGEEVTRVSVYGDDIILPSAVAESFCGLLNFVGFKPNEKKSYWSGPFRESCGKHYFNGHDVTPFYVRRPIKRLTDLFLLHNNLYRFVERAAWMTPEEDALAQKLLRQLRSIAPAKWRKQLIPDGYGDGAFIGKLFDEVFPSPAKGQLEYWSCPVLINVASVPKQDEENDSEWGLPVGSLVKANLLMRRRSGSILFPSDPLTVSPITEEKVLERKLLVPRYAHGPQGRVSRRCFLTLAGGL